jgi:hypothetical protein
VAPVLQAHPLPAKKKIYGTRFKNPMASTKGLQAISFQYGPAEPQFPASRGDGILSLTESDTGKNNTKCRHI